MKTVKDKSVKSDSFKKSELKYDYLFIESQKKNGKKGNKFLGKIIKMNAGQLIFSTLIYVVQSAPVWFMPLVASYVINLVTNTLSAGASIGGEVWRKIIIAGVILGVVILLNIPTTTWRTKIVSKMCRHTSAGIKCALVRKLQRLSITYHKDMQMGKIQSKFLKDTDTVDNLLRTLVQVVVPSLVSAVMAVIVSVVNNGYVSLFFLLVVPLNVVLSFLFRKRIRSAYRDFRIKTEKMSVKLSSMLQMMQVTKAHGLEETEFENFRGSIDQLTDSGMATEMTNAYFGSASWALNQFLSAGCLIFCSALALNGTIDVGSIVLYQSMFTQISAHVSTLINVYPNISSGMEALNSVSEIMNATDVEIDIGKIKAPSIEGNISFKNVDYRYPNTEQLIVKNFNLDVKAGECIAVVGASGSGKSTLMNLIIGFLKPVDGDILIDGKSINDFNLPEYRHHVSVVPQTSILFAGSIRDNITYGLSRYSEEDLRRVIEMANISEFISELPKGLDTDIGEYGDKLSGGQKQRITIARALIRNPKILILDEATSALDNISEFHVQKAISSSIRGRTTFIVAHRLSTIRDADRIVVMEAGEMVEVGSYDELMAKKGKFYELKCLNDINAKKANEALE